MKGIRKLLLAGMVVGVLMLAACTENTQETKQAGSDESATTAAATAQSEEVTEATEAVATTQAEAVTEAATNAEEKAGEITEEEARKFADEKKIPYFETSAKTNKNIKEGFSRIVNEAYDMYEKIQDGIKLKKNKKGGKQKCCAGGEKDKKKKIGQ